jgi:hypothetical protein
VVRFSPHEFLDRLADLVPPPRQHRHRYHGVFAPNHPLRPLVTALAIGNAGPACGGDIRLISFITDPTPIRTILAHVGEPVEPPPVSPARGPPTEWPELVQAHDDRYVVQAAPDELPVIDIQSR